MIYFSASCSFCEARFIIVQCTFSGKSFFGCQCADGRFLFHTATLSAQIISMLKYLICFFYLIDYINGYTRCFLLLQIVIWKKLLNDEGGLPPDRGLPWQCTGVPAGICGKMYGILCNTDMTRITVRLFRLRCNKLLPASQKFADLHREGNLSGMCSVLHPLCYSAKMFWKDVCRTLFILISVNTNNQLTSSNKQPCIHIY